MAAMEANEEERQQLCKKIAKILDETKTSNATHIRKLKDLSSVLSKSPSPAQFAAAFCRTLTPLFCIQRRTSSAERIVRFVSAFAGAHASGGDSGCDEFLEDLLRFLLTASAAANKTARFRACQMISEIIMRLPDDAEVSDEVWDEVIECMMLRVRDKASGIRTFAVRALSRFVNDAENSEILKLLLEVLELEQSAEVRKTILLALPPTNATSRVIVDCTLDVSESVRKAAYCVLANKFPLHSLSIKLRTLILQRGLADRSIIVSKECLKLLRDEWLSKCCNDDPIELLKYLDVETYELVGEAVMDALLKEGSIILDNQSIQESIISTAGENEDSPPNIQLMEPESALYWKTVCRFLQSKAQAKGSDAAVTTGTEAAVYAAEASDSNDLLDRILPATVFDYVALVKAHIDAGANYRFASRQLLLLGAMVDFSDSTCRKVASAFLQNLLHRPLDFETDETGNEVVIGDGLNLGGDKDWADAVTSLAKKVHSGIGEIESAFLMVLEELIRPCRERTADFKQWMHCLSVTGLLLQNAKSFHLLQGQAIQPSELLQSLLLPAAKHIHLDVQRVSIRCLGLFGLLERKPSEDVVKQLRLSFIRGPAPISAMACKSLMDLALWHGPRNVDSALLSGDASQSAEEIKMAFNSVNFLDADDNTDAGFLDLLYAGLDRNDWEEAAESDESEIVQAVLGEGLAKILLLSENYTTLPSSLHPLLLAKLIELYFSEETNDLQRLKQCLSVFFEHYPTISANHKQYLSKAFIPVMHAMWPGIFGNGGGSSVVVSNLRKRAIQASRFMLQMMQAPLYVIQNEAANAEIGTESESAENANHPPEPTLECREEGLAVRIAAELASFTGKRTAAEKSYISALCRTLVLIQFRLSEQDTIKLTRRLLNQLIANVPLEKDVMKELKLMAERLSSMDSQPDEELLQDQADLIFGKLEMEFNLDANIPAASAASSSTSQQTPARTRASRPVRQRRRAKNDDETSSEDEPSSVPVPVSVAGSSRSQRASKTAALNKLQVVAGRKKAATARIEEEDEEDEDDESEVTSEDADDSEEDLL